MQALALGRQKDRRMPGPFECPSDLDMRFLRGLERVWVLLLDLLLSSIGECDGQHSPIWLKRAGDSLQARPGNQLAHTKGVGSAGLISRLAL